MIQKEIPCTHRVPLQK